MTFLPGLRKTAVTKYEARVDRDPIAKRIKFFLEDYCSEADIRACGQHNHDWLIEDFWARLQASHKSDRQIRTEVVGLENVTEALEQGHGVVFWGMSFCGTLFSKIALARAGVGLTQLSAADHGGLFPLTLLCKLISGPLECLPENRYLSDRIRIPVDGGNNYLYRLGDVLKKNGCIWIAGERARPKKSCQRSDSWSRRTISRWRSYVGTPAQSDPASCKYREIGQVPLSANNRGANSTESKHAPQRNHRRGSSGIRKKAKCTNSKKPW